MNRTIKFQLLNVKKSTLFAFLITYGIIGLFLVISLLVDQSVITNIVSQPIWLNLLSFVVAPFALLSMIYALWDGMIFFDSSIRFGVSRRSYFITQLFIYVILSLLISFATGVTEVEWAGSIPNYFATIGEDYLSLENIIGEFLKTVLLALFTLGFYRFKAKSLIVVIVLFGLLIIVASFLNSGFMGNPLFIEMIVNTINFVIEYQEFFVGLIVAGVISVYYLFITKTEVQD